MLYNYSMQKNFVFSLKQSKIDKFKYCCSQIFLFLCVICFTFIIYTNVTYSIAPVSGLSMYPTLNASENYNGLSHYDKVVLNYIKMYKKGDIIVAKKIGEHTEKYVIKRLIALGGDRLEIKSDGSVYVNDVKLDEKYVTSDRKVDTYNSFINYKNTNPKIDGVKIFDENVLIIPKGYVYYLGDNRGASYDCSNYGPVKENNIVAKIDYIIKDGENEFLSILRQFFGGK